jgi:hypothetical protein
MSRRILVAIATFVSAALVLPALSAETAPPDFAPNPSVGWVSFPGGLKPPKSGAGPVIDDPLHRQISNNEFRLTGKQPTFPVADLSNPILQPWVREALRRHNERILAGEPGFGPRQACWPRGVPGFLMEGMFQPVFIIQAPKEIVMVAQGDNHQRRRIYLDVPHSANPKPSWFGESVGRYEGDTLVVDTIGISTKTFVDDYQTPHTDKLHVVERFRMTDGGRFLEVNLHVEDEGAFTMPWDAFQRYRRVEPGVAEAMPVVVVDGTSVVGDAGPLIEETCAETMTFFSHETDPRPEGKTPDF